VTEINYDLLKRLAAKPHPLLNIAEDFEKQIREIPLSWTAEVFEQARTAHHLLDIVGIPQQAAGHYSSDLDARTWQAINLIINLRGQLDRITSWHSRETADGGMVGDFCNECGEIWPCDTRRMADGSHEDLSDTGSQPRPQCQAPTCPDFGDPDFGEGTCPSDHADPPPATTTPQPSAVDRA
jgi:hypothetical protein